MKQPHISTLLFLLLLGSTLFAQPLKPPPADSSQAIADRIIQSDIPVLVDFWAAWCGPCRMLNPIIHDLEKEYKGRVLFIKVNVDINRALSSYFSVSSIPAVFIINNKSVVTSLPGVQPKEKYRSALDVLLNTPDKTSSTVPPKDPSVQ